ncbi:MAG: Lrp/AsnC family transcriptional regulator [Bifidobacteriaceae bacterium]|jgi:DNA-binding Lrp family transcriptional regulator|nr:Lrp/AsnC family transcriptional regulator [Bifidobacteriaceae bacterium]
MPKKAPNRAGSRSPRAKDLRFPLAEVDRQILSILQDDARTPNAAIAHQVGIAPSTCLGRIRAMERAGVIRGYHAEVNQAAFGRTIQAMISVRLRGGARHKLIEFTKALSARPEVTEMFFVGGTNDFLIHVAVADTVALRDFVIDPLSSYPEVGSTETNIIFEHL